MHFFLDRAVEPEIALIFVIFHGLPFLLLISTSIGPIIWSHLVDILSGKIASFCAKRDDFINISHDPLELIWTEWVHDKVVHLIIIFLLSWRFCRGKWHVRMRSCYPGLLWLGWSLRILFRLRSTLCILRRCREEWHSRPIGVIYTLSSVRLGIFIVE